MEQATIILVVLGIVPTVISSAITLLDTIMESTDPWSNAKAEGDQEDIENMVVSICPMLLGSASIRKRQRFETSHNDDGPSWYVKPRSTIDWWNHFVFHAEADDERWREMFRLPIPLFTTLVNLVGDDIRQKPIPLQLSHIPGRIWTVEKKVGLAVLLLATGDSQYIVANTFGCGRSTVSKFLYQFVQALIKNGSSKIHWPATEGEMNDIKEGFRAMQGLPNCCGAIDCTHILMNLPQNEANEAWFDRNDDYSMLVQAVVDHRMRFTDINIGWPGSCNDKRVLRNSGLYRTCRGRERLSGPSVEHMGLSIPEYIVGDGGYPLLPWLMIPFPRPMLTTALHKKYNFMHSSSRIVVERAFGRLKETWKYTGSVIHNPNIVTLPATLHACCILHNMMMDIHMEEQIQPVIDMNDPLIDNPFMREAIGDLEDTPEGTRAREDLMEYLEMQGLAD